MQFQLRSGTELEFIAEIDALENRPDIMVSICSAAENRQDQIDLGKRSGPKD
jgi:hypothetical protein